MPISNKQAAYLEAMGIERWVSRLSTSAPSADSGLQPLASPAGTTEVAAMEWEALRQQVMSCTQCPLHETRTQAVFGVGNPQADLLIIGEAPGADEDRQGEPFVGRAGQLLNEMLRAVGMSRESVYIANILKCRPPNNRDPKPEEAAACLGYLYRQIALIQPKLILAVGRIAAQRLLQTDTPLGRLRQQRHVLAQTQTPLIVTYHPAYLLRSPLDKRKAWQDLLFVQKTIESS
jgi:uracil-DNA glycosylase family 4